MVSDFVRCLLSIKHITSTHLMSLFDPFEKVLNQANPNLVFQKIFMAFAMNIAIEAGMALK